MKDEGIKKKEEPHHEHREDLFKETWREDLFKETIMFKSESIDVETQIFFWAWKSKEPAIDNSSRRISNTTRTAVSQVSIFWLAVVWAVLEATLEEVSSCIFVFCNSFLLFLFVAVIYS